MQPAITNGISELCAAMIYLSQRNITTVFSKTLPSWISASYSNTKL